MEHLQPPEGIFEPTYGFAVEAIDTLDLSEMAYINSCELFANGDHTHDELDVVCAEASVYTNAYKGTLGTLIVDTPLEEFKTIGARLIIEQDMQRVVWLNSVLGRLALSPREEFSLPDLTPAKPIGEERVKLALLNYFTNLFKTDVFADTANFIRRIVPSEGLN